MAKIAILGFGTVGSGVYEILQRNAEGIARRLGQPLEVGAICDVRDFSNHPDAALFTKSFDEILENSEISVVVETIGGTKPAYDFVLRSLQSGRHVATSNKELVSTHGAELLAAAKQNGVCFLFEASVGGGTPIITPMRQSLVANTITSVLGIVNGTTNFMLTKMEKEGWDFDAALAEAQKLGYAETIDPSSDVDGIDAQRKIAILASLSFGKHVYPQNVSARGIRPVTPADMAAAKAMGRAVKLIAWTKLDEAGELAIGVEPMMVSRENQLAGVEDVFNAVMVHGDMLGDVVFYGKGAGKLPTASAVVADAIDALKEGVRIHDTLFWQPAEPKEGVYTDCDSYDFYLRGDGVQALAGAEPVGEGAAVLRGVTPAALEQRLQGAQPAVIMKLL